MKPWYVARTRLHKEKLAAVNLANQKIAAFWPRFWSTVRRRNAFEDQLRPLFPGYIFFQSGEDPAMFRAVGGTMGVSYVLCGDGRKPQPVPPAFMDQMLSSCVDGIFNFAGDQVSVGDRVQIKRGPFSGVIGTVLSLDDASRAALFLDIMGGLKAKINVSDFEQVA